MHVLLELLVRDRQTLCFLSMCSSPFRRVRLPDETRDVVISLHILIAVIGLRC